MSDWEHKVILEAGDTLKLVGSCSKGFVQETYVMTYDMIGRVGAKTGAVLVEDHTAVKGFRRTLRVQQRDVSGKVVVEDGWTV